MWPYREGPGGSTPSELRDYLKQYTIFRYQDDYSDAGGNFVDAIMIPDKDGTWAHKWDAPIKAYEHILYVHDDTLTIGKWPNDQTEGHELHDIILAKTGDSYAWGSFNKSVEMYKVNSKMIHYISGHNIPANVGSHRTITSLD